MERDDLLTEDEGISNEEKKLFVRIASLVRVVANIGFCYAVFITFITLYGIFEVADNTALWRYYQTFAGFIAILVVIIAGILYWVLSWLLLLFGKRLLNSFRKNSQQSFDSSWVYLNRVLMIANGLLLLFVVVYLLKFIRNLL